MAPSRRPCAPGSPARPSPPASWLDRLLRRGGFAKKPEHPRMAERRTRRRFRAEAVRRLLEGGEGLTEVATELGLSPVGSIVATELAGTNLPRLYLTAQAA